VDAASGSRFQNLAITLAIAIAAMAVVPPVPGHLIAYGRSVNSVELDQAIPVSR
jgi:hypothetical protein